MRDFWFGDGEILLKDRGVRRLVRGDLHRLHVKIESGTQKSETQEIELQVERTELFLCKPRVALLVVEVSNCLRDPNTAWDKKFLKPLALNTVQDFQDKFRRAYPPFWKDRLAKEPRQNKLPEVQLVRGRIV